MRILLILPPPVRIKYNISGVYPLPPLGLAYIAAVLEKNGFEVEILDMAALRLQAGDLRDFLDNYAVYGISSNIFNLGRGIEIAETIKKFNPSSTVVLGGRCTTFPAELILKRFSSIDFIIKGEGEKAMLDLCCLLREKRNIDSIAGLSYRNGGSVTNNPPGPYIDLDSLPFPARHLLPNKRYKMHPPFGIYPPVTLMETSRGCNYRCIFCGLQSEVRIRSEDNVSREIKEAVDKLKVREIHFVDPNFTYNQERIMKLCNFLIKMNIKIHWTCKTRVDLVSRELLRRMSRAGCYMISFGVESGSQKILNSLNKGTDIGQIEKTFALCRESGIRTIAYMLLGSPGESESTLRDTVNLVQKIEPDFVLYGELLPDPNSALMMNASTEKDVDSDTLLNFYVDNKYSIFSKNNICEVSHENINRWLKYANIKFYLRFPYLLKRLVLLKNFNELLILIKGVLFLILDRIKGLHRAKQCNSS